MMISNRFKQTTKASNNIEDVYDGQLYKELNACYLLVFGSEKRSQ